MLILGRRAGESIFVGEEIEIRIMDLTASRVKVGIIAPRQLPVLRGEVKRAAEQNREASRMVQQDAVYRLLAQLRFPSSSPTPRR